MATTTSESLSPIYNLGPYLVYFLVTLTGILTAYHYWFQSLRYVKLGNKIPGPRPLPIVGNALMGLYKNPSDILQLAVHEIGTEGRPRRAWFGNRLIVALSDPRDVEIVLSSNVHLEKSQEYRFFEPWLGDGLLISKGDKWRSHRKIIVPTFHQLILKTFMPVFNNNANDLVELLRKDVIGNICDIHDYLSAATVDVLLETVMGVKKDQEEKSSFKYAQAVMDMCAILHFRHVRLWMRLDFIFRLTKQFRQQTSQLKIIHTFTDNVIKMKKILFFECKKTGDDSLYTQAVKEIEEENNQRGGTSEEGLSYGSALREDLVDEDDNDVDEKKRLAFLDFLIEASQTEDSKLTDAELRDQVNTIMFEGHDTTAAASSFFVCILGVYPEIQEKVYQEIKEIFEDSNRPVTFNDTLEMKYLERVLLETMRLYPPVPAITRVIREDVKLASGNYILPKDTTILIPQMVIHRNPQFYPNPDNFDPDNFLPDRCQQRHYYSFIPFSAGPRSCVGRKYAMLKLKVLLSSIVRNFKIKSVVSEKDFDLQADIILKRADGFRVILENRIG